MSHRSNCNWSDRTYAQAIAYFSPCFANDELEHFHPGNRDIGILHNFVAVRRAIPLAEGPT